MAPQVLTLRQRNLPNDLKQAESTIRKHGNYQHH
jgi:hypothetical protein